MLTLAVKKPTKSLGILIWNFKVFLPFRARFSLLNKHFVSSLGATRVREHFKLRAHLLSSYEYLVTLSISVVDSLYFVYMLVVKGIDMASNQSQSSILLFKF